MKVQVKQQRTMGRFFGVAALGVFALVSTPAAQTLSEPRDEAFKRGVMLFEMALRGAVQAGGQRLAERARQVIPTVDLMSDPPIIRGIPVPGGIHFDVQAPDIQSTLLAMDYMLSVRPPARPGGPPSGPARVVASGTVVDPDPMTPSATPSTVFDPNASYSAFVREALVDAMLDSSGVLKLQDPDYLTVSASGAEQPYSSNPLYRDRKLVLSILGADLAAFRQGKLTRDEAKARIKEERF
jgi:hypothetical protein